jgi:hypothetical protein
MLVWLTVAGCLGSAVLITLLPGIEAAPEVWFGLAGPAGVTCAEWIATAGTLRRRPERLTSLRIRVFAGKMIFFAAYVAVLLGRDLVRPNPFIVTFAGYFLVLHIAEAVALHRLLGSQLTIGSQRKP